MPETNFSLVDLKALADPAVKLIEAVRSAVGVVYEPTRIRRQAQAEADAAIILAKNQNAVSDIEIRASERLRDRELRRQKNIEDVTQAGLKALPEAVSKDPIDQDWVYEFYEHCQDVGNQQMQHLWGRILAGEVAKPGSYSLRCLRLIKDIQQKDADTFTRFCTFLWMLPGSGLVPIIPDKDSQTIKDAGIQFTDFLHLEDMGLIQFGQITAFTMKGAKALSIFYYGKHHKITLPEGADGFGLGCALLTSVGAELAPISGSQTSEPYRLAIIEHWRKANYIVEEQQ